MPRVVATHRRYDLPAFVRQWQKGAAVVKLESNRAFVEHLGFGPPQRLSDRDVSLYGGWARSGEQHLRSVVE
jgi:hypothetical protein